MSAKAGGLIDLMIGRWLLSFDGFSMKYEAKSSVGEENVLNDHLRGVMLSQICCLFLKLLKLSSCFTFLKFNFHYCFLENSCSSKSIWATTFVPPHLVPTSLPFMMHWCLFAFSIRLVSFLKSWVFVPSVGTVQDI